jgi:uncharacterized caspase-like protein
MERARRRLLQAGLGGTSLFLPLPWAWIHAQSDGTLKLLKAPKVALVVGNGKYKDAPELKNPANDAKGVGDALKAAGFAVTTKLDTGREELIQSIRDYVNAMEKQKAVGLFYFAGHGVQLDWRNYMLPVDAVIDKIEDVAKQSVDIARLMEGLTKAANPMNIIILDACRENPFGAAKQAVQKGLSQMDAPPHTILAYATSPGNVASDGEGANGLYTENLLREMKSPEAKIEDVFKRVRLGVRRKTSGAQIPWESTSLEEDFWFLPPKELKKISEEEKERRFKEEQEAWEKTQALVQKQMAEAAAKTEAARTAAALAAATQAAEDFLRRYPSGNFAELAQVDLDRSLGRQGEKKIVIASQQGNPYTKGTETELLDSPVGYTRTYRDSDLYSKAQKEVFTQTIASVTDSEIHWNDGLVTDLLGNTRRSRGGGTETGNQNEPFEYAVGKRWTTRYAQVGAKGGRSTREMSYWISGREQVTVAAGTFNAFRIEGHGWWSTGQGQIEVKMLRWKAPAQVRGVLAREETRLRQGKTVLAERRELLSFKSP